MAIEIVRGSNPTISIRVRGCELKPVFTETIQGREVERKSYVTIRKEPCGCSSGLDTEHGEMQLGMDSTGSVQDELGNRFTIEGDTALVYLSRDYTKGLECDLYYLQFNLIDEDNNLFTVGDPTMMIIKPNLVEL